MLNTISEMYFRLHHSKWFGPSMVGLLLVCVLLIAGARPAETQHLYDVSAFQANSNISTLLNRFVQVKGKLDRANGYQVKSDVVGLQIFPHEGLLDLLRETDHGMLEHRGSVHLEIKLVHVATGK